ncbi:two-component system [Desulfosarcina sp. BuS5]|uniref:sensor histidine kinase n=1 Tax=Desulfosarcina sp. BuS5 TaxID=933262 RepID=UPI000AA75EBA|nr:PAS domain-containing sensor histidine kinase [Desulfosarcina sp. BuS5]WDN87267.1 two-component system [Desulfosarcina sp. BuS5]
MLKPKFWDYHDTSPHKSEHRFNFRRIWCLTVLLIAGVSLVPLISITLIDYNVTEQSIESDIMLRTARLVSNTQRSISFFITERRSALDFIVRDNTFESLTDPARLAALLDNIKKGFSGFIDLGVITHGGRQKVYAGPYNLEGRNYSKQNWYQQVLDQGVYISDVFLGFRKIPHVVIAIKRILPDGSFYVFRATLDTKQYNNLLHNLEMAGQGDAFLINHAGILQTPSRLYGKVFQKISLPVPGYAPKTRVLEGRGTNGVPLIIGYRYISNSPFILMVVKQKKEVMETWLNTRMVLIWFLCISITIILIVTLSITTHLVNRIHLADTKRVMTLHQVEFTNRLASIGRLAAGVAHEINNPLAIINEKAGLIKDLFKIKKEYQNDEKIIGLIDSVLSSVKRAGTITKRLLNFARHMDVSIETINLKKVISDVLGFLGKEAEYRSITVNLHVADDIPLFTNDRGKLQQIFLNLINNAFAAMNDGGHLDILAKKKKDKYVEIKVSDDGCGIPESLRHLVFEPFFSTKQKKGTGLGLTITHRLVHEIGGKIALESVAGKGTTFTITLPLNTKKNED